MSETTSKTPRWSAMLASVTGGKYIDGADSVTPEEDYFDKSDALGRQLEQDLLAARAEVEKLKRPAIAWTDADEAEEQLRAICLLCGFDPSDGEGTDVKDVFEAVKAMQSELHSRLIALEQVARDYLAAELNADIERANNKVMPSEENKTILRKAILKREELHVSLIECLNPTHNPTQKGDERV